MERDDANAVPLHPDEACNADPAHARPDLEGAEGCGEGAFAGAGVGRGVGAGVGAGVSAREEKRLEEVMAPCWSLGRREERGEGWLEEGGGGGGVGGGGRSRSGCRGY